MNADVRQRKVIYICAPYRAKLHCQIHCNIFAAWRLAADVWAAGFTALCPHANSAHMDERVPDRAFLDGSLELLRRCDAAIVARVVDPLNPDHVVISDGMAKEIEEAERLSLPVVHSVNELWELFSGEPEEEATT